VICKTFFWIFSRILKFLFGEHGILQVNPNIVVEMDKIPEAGPTISVAEANNLSSMPGLYSNLVYHKSTIFVKRFFETAGCLLGAGASIYCFPDGFNTMEMTPVFIASGRRFANS
jgi:hypothetical protein